MTPRIHTIRQAILPLLVLASAACAPSEGSVDDVGARGAAAEAAVYSVFPEVQPRWIEWPYRFEARRGSTGKPVFATPLSDLPKSIFVEVPIEAGEPVVVHGQQGFAMRVWDSERRGAAELTASGLTYGRTGGGTSFWTARESGAEEWLYLPEGASQLEVARYRIEGGRPQQHEWAIDIYDENDKPRVTMTAPQVFATGGQRVDAKMVLEGDEVVVVLTKWVDGPLLVDPAFVQAGDMSGDRKWHNALLLPSGRVMVLGGYKQIGLSESDLATMELFDPVTNTWSPGPAAASPRVYPTTTVMDDGRVLVVSKTQSGVQAGTEIYNEQSNTWTTPQQPIDDRLNHAALKLVDGRVLVAGDAQPPATTAEIYDPVSNTWISTPPMNAIHNGDNLLPLPNGDAIVVGANVVESYSPSQDIWTIEAPPYYTHTRDGAVVLANGDIVATGGTLVGSGIAWGKGVELYDLESAGWVMLASTTTRRDTVPLSLLKDGSLLLAGGYNGSSLVYASSEIYDVLTSTWVDGPALVEARAGHTQTVLPDGRVLIAGGSDLNTTLGSSEILTGTLVQGAPCASSLECISFLCVDGVCCGSICAGVCMACSVASGAAQDGLCAPVTGAACDDGDPCTDADICSAGVCTSAPKVCPDNPAECLGNDLCEAATGNCLTNPLPDGTPCSVGECVSGVCMVPSSGAGGAGGRGNEGGGGSGGMQSGGGGSGGESSTGGGGTGGQPSGPGGAGGVSTVGVGTSSGAAGGSGEPSSASSGGDGQGADDSGCGCRVGGTEEIPPYPGEMLFFLAALLPLRRKSRVQC